MKAVRDFPYVPERRIENTLIPLLLSMFLLGALAVMFYTLLTQYQTATVVYLEWQHEQQVEIYQPRLFTSWGTSAPPDAYNVSHQRALTATFIEDAHCEATTTQDYLCDQTVYTAKRWGFHTALMNTGTDTAAMTWPEPNIRTCWQVGVGCQRPGEQIGHYNVALRIEGGDTYTCEAISMAHWQHITPGTQFKVRVDALTGDILCDTVQWVNSSTVNP